MSKITKRYLGKRRVVSVESIDSTEQLREFLEIQKNRYGVKPVIYSTSRKTNVVFFKFVFGLEGRTLTVGLDGKGHNVLGKFIYNPRTCHCAIKAERFWEIFPERLAFRANRNVVVYGFISVNEKIAAGLYPWQIERLEE